MARKLVSMSEKIRLLLKASPQPMTLRQICGALEADPYSISNCVTGLVGAKHVGKVTKGAIASYSYLEHATLATYRSQRSMAAAKRHEARAATLLEFIRSQGGRAERKRTMSNLGMDGNQMYTATQLLINSGSVKRSKVQNGRSREQWLVATGAPPAVPEPECSLAVTLDQVQKLLFVERPAQPLAPDPDSLRAGKMSCLPHQPRPVIEQSLMHWA